LKIKILILFSILFILNCGNNRIYHNKFFRYKIKYPEAWIAVNSGHDIKAEDDFKQRLNKENSPIKSYQNVDVVFYNPNSSPPIFEQVAISSQQARFEYSKINEMLPFLKNQFSSFLTSKFKNVKNIQSQMEKFKDGNIFKFEYYFNYNNVEYFTVYIIIPGKLFGTYYINGLCKKVEIAEFNENFNYILTLSINIENYRC
jgi:hypothetical protein